MSGRIAPLPIFLVSWAHFTFELNRAELDLPVCCAIIMVVIIAHSVNGKVRGYMGCNGAKALANALCGIAGRATVKSE